MLRINYLVFLIAAANLSAAESIVPPDLLGSLRQSLTAFARIVPATGQPFAEALQLQTPEPNTPTRKYEQEYDLRIRGRNSVAVKKGSVATASFYVRKLQPQNGKAYTRFNVERAASPYTKSVAALITVGPDWKHVRVPFAFAEDYAPGELSLDFWIGFGAQVIEIADVAILQHGTALPIEHSYSGRAPDAAWRVAAADRIERHRKADLRVMVLNAEGKPVPDAAVRVKMRRHAFGFGSAVDAENLLGSSPDAERYRATFLANFNKAVFENDLKWPDWERTRQRSLRGVNWMRQNGVLAIRGHTLVWPAYQWLPADVAELKTPDELRKRINGHLIDIVSTLRAQVPEWDVLNEPYSSRDLQKLLTDQDAASWFRTTRETSPFAKLFVNDFDIVEQGGEDGLHQDYYYETIQGLIANGAPVGGIGIQGHFNWFLTPPERLLQILDRFAEFGKELQITEFDVSITDEQLQADYTRDLLTAVFSHPAATSVLTWGFWEGRHWQPQAAMYRKDWSIKPNGAVWKDLVLRQWWTDVEGRTDTNGVFSVRGFLGDYTVEVGGAELAIQSRLTRDGLTVEVVR